MFYSNLLFRQQSAIHSLSNHQALFIFICFYSNLFFRQQSAIHSLFEVEGDLRRQIAMDIKRLMITKTVYGRLLSEK
jgi:ribosomal protein S13